MDNSPSIGNMQARIFLIGFMGSGKSTAGQSLARKIGYRFVDMDDLIEETSGMRIPGIFRELGEEMFRKWERDILLELCARERVVISTGGGAPCHDNLMDIMNEQGCTVYLKMPPSALKDRLIRSSADRPLIRGKSEPELLQFIRDLLSERKVFYEQAKIHADGINLDIAGLVESIRNFCS